LPGWARVNFRGWQNRQQIKNLLSDVRAGLVTLHPTVTYVEALPIKMFEYMIAGYRL
jgi:hypothetical protein